MNVLYNSFQYSNFLCSVKVRLNTAALPVSLSHTQWCTFVSSCLSCYWICKLQRAACCTTLPSNSEAKIVCAQRAMQPYGTSSCH